MTNFATTSIMPLLARLVIAAAMLTSGWANCFGQIEIRTSIADGLRAMEIEVHDPEVEETPSPAEEEKVESAKLVSVESTPMPITNATTRGVHRIVWIIHEKWPNLGGWGIFVAWSAAVAQLVAGVLLLVGLFTRFAALAICIAIGMAIYLVSGGIHGMFTMNPFDWPHDSHRFIQLFAGLGLFTLSLGLLFGGPGGFSLDAKQKNIATEKKVNSTKNSSD
jgi:uncharacterized membrane protein YphA (DoxX/SURF4 family)